jgi:Ala-tRNA(Pro) deacylase
MPAKKLKEFLDAQHVPYITITHSLAFTAQGIAALTHIPGQELAKTVIVKIDDQIVMAVLPATRRVDLAALRVTTGAKSAALASEREFRDMFPDCEVGAMPPFGNLFGMPVFVDETLAEDKEIAFNAGTHRELIRMSFEDFRRLVKPTILNFAAMRTAFAA